jgi:hypothetical protein
MSQNDHWEQVYSTKSTEKLGWYKPHLETPLSWIKDLSLPVDAPIIDIGGGRIHVGRRPVGRRLPINHSP